MTKNRSNLTPVSDPATAVGRSTGRTFLDVAGVAEIMGVAECYVRRMVWERRLPHYKIGKYVRFDLAEVLECIESCRVEPLR